MPQASNFVTIDKNLRRHLKIPRGLAYPLPIGQCFEILVCDWPSHDPAVTNKNGIYNVSITIITASGNCPHQSEN